MTRFSGCRRRLIGTWLAVVGLALGGTGSASAYDWSQFGGDAAHSGNNTAERSLASTTANHLSLLFDAKLPGVVDSPTVYRRGVSTPSGLHNVLYATTRGGATVAVNADTGSTLWSRTVGPGSCKINNGSAPCYTTAAPALDASGSFVYAYGLDGRAHKYVAGTGAETTSGGWPELTTTKGFDEKGSSDLSVATSHGVSYLYVANGGYPGDHGDYQGHVTTINLATGAQRVFNTLCSDKTQHFADRRSPDCGQVQSAVWSRPSVIYDSRTDRILLTTGNGDYNPAQHNWGDTVLALHPDGTGINGGPLDSYTPANYRDLQNADADLGSTAPALLAAPAGSTIGALGVQSGKDAKLRLLNLGDLSGRSGPGHTGGALQVIDVPQGGRVLTQPTTWTNPNDHGSWFFVANASGLSAVRVVAVNGKPQLRTAWKITTGGTTPVVANNVLYYLTSTGAKALDPVTGTTLWSESSSSIGLHWQGVIVADAHLYYPDGQSRLRAFTLPAATLRPGPIVGLGGLCLDVRHSGTANGTPIQIYSCNQTGAQHWTLAGDGSIRAFGKCLDDDRRGTANGNRIQLYACNGSVAQRWSAAADGSLRVLGHCLDVPHSRAVSSTAVQLYQCNGTGAQRWRTP